MVISGHSQEISSTVSQEENSGRRNDIMFNPIALVLGVGGVSYEYHLNQNSGLGLTVFFVLDDYFLKNSYWYMLPYYRYCFGQAQAKGFFLEGFTGVVNIDPYDYRDHSFDVNNYLIMEKQKALNLVQEQDQEENGTQEAILFFEVGRLFSHDFETIFLKGMLGVGYRF